MEPSETVRLHAAPHPSPPVRQAGFALDHPYLEQCWTPVIGPTSVLLLRRMPLVWQEDLSPAVDLRELAASLGLGRSSGRNGALQRTVERLVRFRFASHSGPGELDVFTEAPPVPDRQLDRLPAWNRSRHDVLLGAHLDRLAELHHQPPSPGDITGRLNALTRPTNDRHPTLTLHR